MRNFLSDARRFAVRFNPVIEETPLQIYVSALLFAPQKSVVRGQFETEIPSWICQRPIVADDWSPFIQIIPNYFMDGIIDIKFSPDSKLMVVIISSNCQVWETSTWKKN